MARVVERCAGGARVSSLAAGRGRDATAGDGGNLIGRTAPEGPEEGRWVGAISGFTPAPRGGLGTSTTTRRTPTTRMGSGEGSMDATATAPAPQHLRALERAN